MFVEGISSLLISLRESEKATKLEAFGFESVATSQLKLLLSSDVVAEIRALLIQRLEEIFNAGLLDEHGGGIKRIQQVGGFNVVAAAIETDINKNHARKDVYMKRTRRL